MLSQRKFTNEKWSLAPIRKLKKKINFGKFWTSKVQFLDLDLVKQFWV